MANYPSSAYVERIERNRQVLKSILEIIILCGKTNFPLSGHDEETSNFYQLINFRAQTDRTLAYHLEHSPLNAQYLSPNIQNELIALCADHTCGLIVTEYNKAFCFSLLADETTYVSTKDQIILCLHFVELNQIAQKVTLHEEFLGFVEAESFIKNVKTFGVDLNWMRGQGYDGAANMSDCTKGLQKRILQLYTHAKYVHCQAHCLNHTIGHACSDPLVRNMSTVQQISFISSYSAKRLTVFQSMHAEDGSQKSMYGSEKIKKLCETRYCSRADSLRTFKPAFSVIVETLAPDITSIPCYHYPYCCRICSAVHCASEAETTVYPNRSGPSITRSSKTENIDTWHQS